MRVRDFVRERYLGVLGGWLVVYLGLFLYLEIVEPEEVFLISCGVDRWIPCLPGFVFIYLSWFPYILVCAWLAIRNLSGEEYREVVFVLMAGMNVFLLISYVWPTGLDLREGIVYDLGTVSGRLLRFVQTVDTPKSVFPSMHVYVTLVLQYSLELQRKRLPLWGIWAGRLLAAGIILSTMFTKQHSVVDVTGAIVLFVGLLNLKIDRILWKIHGQNQGSRVE